MKQRQVVETERQRLALKEHWARLDRNEANRKRREAKKQRKAEKAENQVQAEKPEKQVQVFTDKEIDDLVGSGDGGLKDFLEGI